MTVGARHDIPNKCETEKNVDSITVLEKIGLVFKNTIEKAPKGSEFYLGEFYYSIKRDQYHESSHHRSLRQNGD